MLPFKAIIFDLDGTLLNTLTDLADSMNQVLKQHNFLPYPTDQYRFFVGKGMNHLVKNASSPYTNDDHLILQMQHEMRLEYEKNWHNATKPYDKITETLINLHNAGFKLSVLSNKPDRFTKLTVSYFFPQIPFFMVTGARENIANKPDPAGVNSIIFPSKLSRDEFIMIGDSCIDIQTAKNASIFPAGVLWGFRDQEELVREGARFIFKNPEEIFSFLTQSN